MQLRCTTVHLHKERGWITSRAHNQGIIPLSFLGFTCILISENTAYILYCHRAKVHIVQECSLTLEMTFFILPPLKSLLSLSSCLKKNNQRSAVLSFRELKASHPSSAVFASLVWNGILILPQQPLQLCTNPMFHGPKCIPSHAVTSPEYIG